MIFPSGFQFSSISSGLLHLNYFLKLQKSEHKNKDFVFISCDELKFAICPFTVSFAELKNKLFTVFTEQRCARMFEATLKCSLTAYHLVSAH